MGRLYRHGRLVTTAAVGRRGARFFVAQRKPGGSESLRWEFPGGKCDDDTAEPPCLQREFMEEFGVAIAVHHEVGSVPFEHNGTRYILVGYAVDIPQKPLELREHVACGWYTPEELRSMDLSQSDRVLLEKLLVNGDPDGEPDGEPDDQPSIPRDAQN